MQLSVWMSKFIACHLCFIYFDQYNAKYAKTIYEDGSKVVHLIWKKITMFVIFASIFALLTGW